MPLAGSVRRCSSIHIFIDKRTGLYIVVSHIAVMIIILYTILLMVIDAMMYSNGSAERLFTTASTVMLFSQESLPPEGDTFPAGISTTNI